MWGVDFPDVLNVGESEKMTNSIFFHKLLAVPVVRAVKLARD